VPRGAPAFFAWNWLKAEIEAFVIE